MNQIEKLQQKLGDEVEAVLINDRDNRFYFTGLLSSAGTLVITKNKAVLFIDFRYLEEAEKQVTGCRVIEQRDLYGQISEILKKENCRCLSVLIGNLTLADCAILEINLNQVCIDKSGRADAMVEKQRMIKTEEEIASHSKAQKITDGTFQYICNVIKPGMTELEVAIQISMKMHKLGSETSTWNYIVASGPNGSKPHGFASDRVLQKGEMVTMDFGAVVNGRLADMTRTVAIGKIPEEQKKVYEIVQEAQKRCFDKIRPGISCCDVDEAARSFIYSKGYQGCFSHGLGHSIGVEVHENPRFNETCRDILKPGMVMTVEPGIYLKGKFGVRIEDMVVVEEDGFRNLTGSPSELIIL